MTASISIPYEVGQSVWRASPSPIERWVTCPECAGTRAVTMTLGNGEEYSLACAYCTTGYGAPTGLERHWDYDCEPEKHTCGDLEIWNGAVRYGGIDADHLYVDKEECRAHCHKLNEEHRENAESMALNNLKSKRRGMAWSVHYWGSEVRKLRKDLERAEARLHVCKEKKAARAEKAK